MSHTNHLPSGIQPTPLDAALLVASLREVYRIVQRRARATASDEVRVLCRELMLFVEAEIEGIGGRRAAWDALKADLLLDLRGQIAGGNDVPAPES